MRTPQIMNAFIALIAIGSFVSCSENEISYEETSSINSAATTVSYTYKPEVKTETSTLLLGTWETFNSGSKSKWKFDDGKLYRSTVYSFGEIGEPQIFKIDYKHKCNGSSDKFGKTITLISQKEKGNYTICYTIRKKSNQEIILEPTSGQNIKLERKN